MSRENFLERWSRLKKVASTTPAAGELPDLATLLQNLGPDSDFGIFLRAEVSEDIRRQAMKTLFADPHFNVMDGLDTYIDDYSISEPIPEPMLAGLRQLQELDDAPSEAPPPIAGPVSERASPTEPAVEAPIGSLPPSAQGGARCDILAGGGQIDPVAAADDGAQAPQRETKSMT